MNQIWLLWKYEKALEYEIFKNEEYWFAKSVIKKANIILDIWWHIGLFSLRCRTINKEATIYFYEPILENFKIAKSKLRQDEKIVLNNYWIAWESYKWPIIYNKKKSMQSSKYNSFLNEGWEKKLVEFISLNEIIEKIWDKIDLVKIDIEWMEFEILESLENINWIKIKNIIIEVHILNDELNSRRENLKSILNKKYDNFKIIPSKYNNKIFIARAQNVCWN